jgi:hypothetical protein
MNISKLVSPVIFCRHDEFSFLLKLRLNFCRLVGRRDGASPAAIQPLPMVWIVLHTVVGVIFHTAIDSDAEKLVFHLLMSPFYLFNLGQPPEPILFLPHGNIFL